MKHHLVLNHDKIWGLMSIILYVGTLESANRRLLLCGDYSRAGDSKIFFQNMIYLK